MCSACGVATHVLELEALAQADQQSGLPLPAAPRKFAALHNRTVGPTSSAPDWR